MADSPIYNIGDIVYVRESASVGGYLESYKITGVQLVGISWIYTIAVSERAPLVSSTVGDRNNLRNGYNITFKQTELCDLCTAVDLAITYHQNALTKLQATKSTYCS